MEAAVISDLVKIANQLDAIGEYKLAGMLDSVTEKLLSLKEVFMPDPGFGGVAPKIADMMTEHAPKGHTWKGTSQKVTTGNKNDTGYNINLIPEMSPTGQGSLNMTFFYAKGEKVTISIRGGIFTKTHRNSEGKYDIDYNFGEKLLQAVAAKSAGQSALSVEKTLDGVRLVSSDDEVLRSLFRSLPSIVEEEFASVSAMYARCLYSARPIVSPGSGAKVKDNKNPSMPYKSW